MCSDETNRNHPAPASADSHSPAPAQRTAIRAGDDPARQEGGVTIISGYMPHYKLAQRDDGSYYVRETWIRSA